MDKMQLLIENVVKWANDKDLLKLENSKRQYLKFLEEVGETCRAILKDEHNEMVDGFGDIAVTVIIYAKQLGYKIDDRFMYNELYESKGNNFNDFLTYISQELFYYALNMLNELALEHTGEDLEHCLGVAYNVIKNRTGQTINGTFIKD